jgi:hypothetical protein
MSTTTMASMNRTTATTMAAYTTTLQSTAGDDLGGGDTRERDELGRRWVDFSFEDEDNVDRIDDGHDHGADCGDDDGRLVVILCGAVCNI